MVSLGFVGMLLCFLQGTVFTVQLVYAKLLKDNGWPFFRLTGSAAAGNAAVLALGCWLAGVSLPARREWKWVILRSFLGVANYLLLIVAVRLGTSPGDASSLSSVNMVMGSVLGRIFLKEPFLWAHVLSICCSLAGAVLISRPSFMFGSDASGGAHWLGYVLSVLAGLSQAGSSIAARKSGTASVSIMTEVTMLMSGVTFWLLPLTPLVEDFSLEPLPGEPWRALGYLCLLWSCGLLAVGMTTAGSKWVPAAVSQTVGTASRMLWGYVAQVLVFRTDPDTLTTVGAVLMLCGVVAMTLARAPARSNASEGSVVRQDATLSAAHSNVAEGSGGDADEKESLASFVAAEFVERAAHDAKPTRQRRPQAAGARVDIGRIELGVQAIGAAASLT